MLVETIKATLWDVVWFVLSLFGRIGLWEHLTTVGGWINGRYDPYWVHPLIVRAKRDERGDWMFTLPEDHVPLAAYSNMGLFGFEQERFQNRKYKMHKAVKGDVILFYFGGEQELFGKKVVRHTSAVSMIYNGWRWKNLVIPPMVNSFHIKEPRGCLSENGRDCYGGGYVQFRNGAAFEWECSTRAGISDHILLDFLGGRMGYGEFLATYTLGLQEKQVYVSQGLSAALTSLEKTKDAFKSGHVAHAVDCIKLALRHT